MRVLHFSDIHLPTALRGAPARSFFGKRAVGWLNLQLRRKGAFRDGFPKVEALSSLCSDQEVDLLIMSGDYSTLGTEVELAAARQAVDPLIAQALSYVTVPGNHDVYLPDALRDGRFERHFGDLLGSDLPNRCTDGPWPLVRLVGDEVAVVVVNSSRPNPQVLRSSGRVPAEQLASLMQILDEPPIRTRFVFIVTHYAPCLADGRGDKPHHGLENAHELLAAVAEVERGALLCGHIHHGYRVQVPEVQIPIFCAGSATYAGRENVWLFDIEPDGARCAQGSWSGEGWHLGDWSRV
ncbi:MAG: metallophosphoesterase [Acidobacteriota bacterium]